MINLSAIARKPVASKKTEYPVIDNPGAPASEDFHIARHQAFPAEVNLLIEDLLPMVAAVKTKGRK